MLVLYDFWQKENTCGGNDMLNTKKKKREKKRTEEYSPEEEPANVMHWRMTKETPGQLLAVFGCGWRASSANHNRPMKKQKHELGAYILPRR